MSSPANDTLVHPEITLQNIGVTFGTTIALDDVTISLRPGERYAVVGENGAGKSTLMRVLFGLQNPTAGSITINGTPVRFASPAEAMKQGIGMVQQHFELIEAFTIAENILLGAEGGAKKGILFDRNTAIEIIQNLSDISGLPINPSAVVGTLSVAARQRVEILKALYRKARVLILDEPTAVLSPPEASELWTAVQRLADSGTTIVFVTHNLEDVMANADTITVLRQGKHIFTKSVTETTAEQVAQAMVGSGVSLPNASFFDGNSSHPSNRQPVLRLKSVSLKGARDIFSLRNIDLTVSAGEIVGIAGVDGSGQTELLEVITGLQPVQEGNIFFDTDEVTHLSIARRRQWGLACIPADRHRQAVVLPLSCEENVILGQQRLPAFSSNGILRLPAIGQFLKDRVAMFDVRNASAGLPVRSLSGGNQQKLVLARELSTIPKLLIAAQPTRGLDFAATAFVRETLQKERNRGCAILLQSLDLEEIRSLSDRVLVMREGRIVGELKRTEATMERLGALMTGADQVV